MQTFPSGGGVRWGTSKQTSKQTSALAQPVRFVEPSGPMCLPADWLPSFLPQTPGCQTRLTIYGVQLRAPLMQVFSLHGFLGPHLTFGRGGPVIPAHWSYLQAGPAGTM